MREDTYQDKYKFKTSIENRKDTVQFVEELVTPIDANENESQTKVIDEEDFRDKYLTEQHMTKIAIDLITIAGQESKPDTILPASVNCKEFSTVEEMVKQIFPQIIATDETPVGTATTCVHEIHLKPGTRPVKQRIRQVPINLREEFKKCIDKMIERGIIRPSQSEWASPTVLVKKKTGELRICIDY